ncbi:MAG: excinuclease ABC subunit C [Candidatus Midichloriaceae bacterium]|jgi:excinuclease ABC subunit C
MLEITRGISVIKRVAKVLGDKPGIYKMLGSDNKVLYIGKAKNLSKRVIQYSNVGDLPNRLKMMVSLVYDVEVVITNTETEALILESDFIKNHKPKYNILLKDDKSYPYIAVDIKHDFPRLIKTRSTKCKDNMYFGPFLSANKLDNTIVELQKIFLLRSCSDSYFHSRKRPCLMYQIKRCSAPCMGYIESERYKGFVEQCKLFLQGKSKELQNKLITQMNNLSESLYYEDAAAIRDKIELLTYIQSKNVFCALVDSDIDIFYFYKEDGYEFWCVHIYIIRNGRSLGNKVEFFKEEFLIKEDEVLEKIIVQFYEKRPCPQKIWSNVTLKNKKTLVKFLNSKNVGVVNMIVPRLTEEKSVMEFIKNNTKNLYDDYIKKYLGNVELFKGLSRIFELPSIPQKIEVYDNSHNQGDCPVGCVVVVDNSGFLKGEYRKYKFEKNDFNGVVDDYGMFRDVIRRRFSKNERDLPDLLLIDGGKGQLSAVQSELLKLGIVQVPVVAMSKGKDRNAGREFFHQNNRSQFQLKKDDKLLLFLQKIRDEAHKFAVISHRKMMSGASNKSALDLIPGVGIKRKKILLSNFGSVANLMLASQYDISQLVGFNQKLAKIIFQYIHKV